MRKILSILFICVIVLSACGSKSDEAGIITYSSGKPESLNINEVSAVRSMTILADANQTLYEYNKDGDIVLAGASDVKISDDGKTYDISLNPELVWVNSDGSEMDKVTANDYVFAYQNMVNPDINGSLNYLFAPVLNASEIREGSKPVDSLGVSAVSDYELQIQLEKATPYFSSMLANVAFAPQPQGAFEEFGADYATAASKTWYSGPFYINEYDEDYEVSLLHNDNYYDEEAVQLNGVNYRIIEDNDSAVTAFKDGQIDFAEVKEANLYESDENINDNQSASVSFFRLNTDSDSVTSDPDLRAALFYSFDRDSILDSLYGDINTPVTSLVPQGLTPPAYDGKEYFDETNYGDFDNELALSYLDKYMSNNDISDPSEITISYLVGDDDKNKSMGELIQANYTQNLGITFEVNTVAVSSYYDMRSAGNYDFVGGIWVPDYSDPSTYLDTFESANIGASNLSRFNNQAYDKLSEEARYETDVDTRFEKYHELEDMVFDNYLIIPFYQMNEPYLLSDEFTIYVTETGLITNKYTVVND